MKIAVIGATGKAGSLIAAEARKKDYEVTAVVRAPSVAKLNGAYPVIAKEIADVEPADLAGFAAVVSAYGPSMGSPDPAGDYITTMGSLISVMEQLPQVRFLVVGGASSLYADERREHLVFESIPPAFRAVPEAAMKMFATLKESKTNWTYFSPAATFDPNGRRIGRYVLGTDYRIPNASAESYISYADYAVAMVDELTRKDFVGKRFTAVSDTSYIQREKEYSFFDITQNPFVRRYGYFGIYSRAGGFSRSGVNYGSARLSIGSRRGAISEWPDNRLMDLFPVYKGAKVAFSVKTGPTEIQMKTLYGTITLCFPEPSLLYIKGEGGISLKMEIDKSQSGIIKKRKGKAWETYYRWIGSLVFNRSGRHRHGCPWNWETLTTPKVKAHVLRTRAVFLLAVEESKYAGVVRDRYPTYEEGLADVNADWESFLATILHFVKPFEERRGEAAYILWSHLVGPSGKVKRPLMYMFGTSCASSWQMCHNAVALEGNPSLAAELMLNPLDEASPVGQLPDFYDDMRGHYMWFKPPLQGWTLKWMMKKHDLARVWPREKIETMYEGFGKWADWFLRYRDDDHDGIPQYEHGDEAGFDDNTAFMEYSTIESPDLCAYLGLLYESLGDLGKMLGKDAAEIEDWYRKSREIIDRMVKPSGTASALSR
jgi:putative NADH-flavin reductase